MTKRPRNSVADRPSAWKLHLRRARKHAKPVAIGVLGLSAAAFAVALVRASDPSGTIASARERIGGATGALGLRVAEIRFEGRAATPEPLLRAALGVAPGDPILGFSVDQARQRIETLSTVEHATVERRLPGRIVVVLAERRPFALWQNKGKFAVVDRDGKTLDNQDPAQHRGLPLIVGEGAPRDAAPLLAALADRAELKSRVQAAVRVGERRWNLRLRNGADVLLPEGHEIAALDRLMELHKSQALLDRPLAAIDLRLGDRLVLRPRAETPAAPQGAQAVQAAARNPTDGARR